jgi:flagellar motor protein MotB
MGALRKIRTHEIAEVDTDGSWAISYGDMITLLLTFFILFFSTNKDRDRMQAMDHAIMVRLDPTHAEKLENSKIDKLTATQIKESAGPDQVNARVYKVGDRMIVEFPATSFYKLGEVAVSKEGKQALASFVKQYMPYAGNYILGIRSYTDNKKVLNRSNRRFKDNLELSALRSVAAMRTLQSLGIPLSRMRLGGYGELNLTADQLATAILKDPKRGADGLALARKVVLVIEPEVKEAL